jgi:hypothetical protein
MDAGSPVDGEELKPVMKMTGIGGPTVPGAQERKAQPVAAAACTHQLGYLSKRSPKEKIPEDCMMCGNIVQCMLKNITE